MKIAVIGYTGSGKSVLAAKLGKIIGCPVLHLDKLQFEAGWKERGEAEGKMLCEQIVAGSLMEIMKNSARKGV